MAVKPKSFEYGALMDSKILMPVLIHLQLHALLCSMDNQIAEERCQAVFILFVLGLKHLGHASTGFHGEYECWVATASFYIFILHGYPMQTFPESFYLLHRNSTIDKQLLEPIPQCPGMTQGSAQTFGNSVMKQVPCCQFCFGLTFKLVVTKTCLY